MLISRISLRISNGTVGLPPRAFDFQRTVGNSRTSVASPPRHGRVGRGSSTVTILLRDRDRRLFKNGRPRLRQNSRVSNFWPCMSGNNKMI
jgi:hypothetical protein